MADDQATLLAKLEKDYDLPAGVLTGIWEKESSKGKFLTGPRLPSGERAQGNFQFLPETAKKYGVKFGDFKSEATGAARYLSDRIKANNGDVQAALKDYGGFKTADASGYIKAVAASSPAVLEQIKDTSSKPVQTAAAIENPYAKFLPQPDNPYAKFVSRPADTVPRETKPEQPSLIEKALSPITGIPKAVGEEFSAGAQMAGEATRRGAELSQTENPWNPITQFKQGRAGLEGLAGTARAVASPLGGAIKSMIGDPFRANLPEKVGGIPVAEPIAQGAEFLGAGALPIAGVNALRGISEARSAAQAARAAEIDPGIRAAREAGFKIPPGNYGTASHPGVVPNALAQIGGKDKTQQAFSFENQKVANHLGAEELGLPSDTTLTPAVFNKYRDEQGGAYAAVKKEQPLLAVDQDYKDAVAGLGGRRSAAAQTFDDIAKDAVVRDVRQTLLFEKGKREIPDIGPPPKNLPDFVKWQNEKEALEGLDTRIERDSIPTNAAIEKVRDLRADSRLNFKGAEVYGDPGKKALAQAQRDAADALDALIDRHLTRVGRRDLMNEYRTARTNIAKSHELEDATDKSSFNVDARYLGRRLNNGAYLTGNLKTMADAANLAPKVFQEPPKIGMLNTSALHGIFGLGSLPFVITNPRELAGWVGANALLSARPMARSALMSERMQNRIVPIGNALP